MNKVFNSSLEARSVLFSAETAPHTEGCEGLERAPSFTYYGVDLHISMLKFLIPFASI
jgi:hypothetical protein